MIVVQPVLLHSKSDIARTFKVRGDKVTEWQKKGAPISRDGRRYTAELNALQSWLVGLAFNEKPNS